MMKDPTLKDWGKLKVQNTNQRVSATVEIDEWGRYRTFASKHNMTIAGLLRAGVRKILAEAKVEQPQPARQWFPDFKEKRND